jgi:hypothetical protein
LEHEKKTKLRKKYCCGGAEESLREATATRLLRWRTQQREVVDPAAALLKAVAPVGAPRIYSGSGERSAYCYGGAEGGEGEEEKEGNAAAAMPHAVAPVGAPSAFSCGGAEERKECGGN